MASNSAHPPFSQLARDFLWLSLVNAYCYVRHPALTFFAMRWGKALPNPAYPTRSTDKFLWRKIFDRDPATVAMSDKLAAKQIARKLCPDIEVPRTLWVGDRFEDIPAQLLSGDVMIKSSHGSGFFHAIRNGNYDRRLLMEKTRKWLQTDYSRYNGEWNYKAVTRKLFVEEFLKDADGQPVSREAKISVFGSTALFTFWFHDRLTDRARLSLYDAHGKAFDYQPYLHYPVSFEPPPDTLKRMFDVAVRLAGGRDHVRVDLYEVDGRLYFSEYTFYNMAGRFGWGIQKEFPQTSWLWDLRRTWFLAQPQPGWRGAYARWLKSRLERLAAQAYG